MTGLLASLLWACSKSGDEPVARGGAGEGSGGSAGATMCEVPSLEDFCADRDCPEGPDDFDLGVLCGKESPSPRDYELAEGVDRYGSDCGGVIIELWGGGVGWHFTRYSFDEHGNLLGFLRADDVAEECPDVVGTTCSPVGEPEPLCEVEACGPYPLIELCDEHPLACPASPQDVDLQGLCNANDVQRHASACGGTVIIAGDDPLGSTAWTFDAEDQLVGVIGEGDLSVNCEAGGFSFTVIHGNPCEAQGVGEDLCLDLPGAGGAGGAGGAAGSPN